ncbi:MAG: hypothetical protein PQ612_00695 [Rickettsiales bacterium]|nr:hypothetical protein [Pseudomonadota bacterium]MDA0965568.1 hypothetical protein [Pseudomonadota bacterium]MDG4542892.1 hypothetical protein [Rickettsiales bacterium]MDG4544660.1 hypothetical protein [Rickettsiales bacterium]MDG4546782.1 hypothetical protein [Rickettsiales bacterium]
MTKNTEFRKLVSGVYESDGATKIYELMSGKQGRQLMNRPLVELVKEAGITSQNFADAIDYEKKSIDRYFKYYKNGNDKDNFEFRQSTLNSKRMLNAAKNAVIGEDNNFKLGDAEGITPLATPVICRIINHSRLDSGIVADDTISEFSRYESPEIFKKELEVLGKWTKNAIDSGLTKGHHLDDILLR